MRRQIGWFALPPEMLSESAFRLGMKGYPNCLARVRFLSSAWMFSETRDGLTKVSFRYAGTMPFMCCCCFWWGGHAFAAGATLNEPFEKPSKRVLAKTRAMLTNWRLTHLWPPFETALKRRWNKVHELARKCHAYTPSNDWPAFCTAVDYMSC